VQSAYDSYSADAPQPYYQITFSGQNVGPGVFAGNKEHATKFLKAVSTKCQTVGSYQILPHPMGLGPHHRPMAPQFRLSEHAIVAFVASSDVDRARKFYGDILGLHLIEDHLPFALVYDAHGTMLRVTTVERVTPAAYTVLGWHVPDIAAATEALWAAGVRFERYAGMDQDEVGIWTSPNGGKVAWFKDPDGNTLSISQHD